jgi:hypothetical protein
MSRRRCLGQVEESRYKFAEQLKQTGEPVILTINGKGLIVVHHVGTYQKLHQIAEEARVLNGIRLGNKDMNTARTVSLVEFKQHARAKHGIPA